ncbi:MAG: hypothetical protein J3K34DRAFT_238796 [Monoraphidium minutum]|nr:MAG: hypothetical protein J3K34DRAFT_238796 [Monoraphidium minutum]
MAAQAAFLEWLKRRGAYISPKLDLFGEGTGGDRTVRAREDVEDGERLLLVPEEATLTLGSGPGATGSAGSLSAQSPAAAYLSEAHPTLSPFMRTVLLLMSEIARGEDSPWHAYIASLPESTDCLITWPKEDRALLEGTSIEDKGRSAEEIWDADLSPLVALRPDAWPPAGGFAAFRRAAELVQTRAFHLKAENWVTGAVQEAMEQLYLVPAMDMLNHSTRPELRNTALERIKSPMTVEVEGVGEVSFEAFFTMKAGERAGGPRRLRLHWEVSGHDFWMQGREDTHTH